MVILGSGPAGLSAAIYAQRACLDTLVIEKEFTSGGQMASTYEVDNYPGLPGMGGFDLGMKFREHAEKLGASFVNAEVVSLQMEGEIKVVSTMDACYKARTVVIATGARHRLLQVPGEEELTGMGVSYCATCDGDFYRGKTIGVICNAARFEHEVKYLAELAEKVYYFPTYGNPGEIAGNVEMMPSRAERILGEKRADGIQCRDGSVIKIDGVFCLRDGISLSTLLPGLALENGHIVVSRQMETNLPGVYAAGDCTGRPYQYAKAVGEGNVAAHSLIRYLAESEA